MYHISASVRKKLAIPEDKQYLRPCVMDASVISGTADAVIQSVLQDKELLPHINTYFKTYKKHLIKQNHICSVCRFLFTQSNDDLPKVATSLRLIKRIAVRLPCDAVYLLWYIFKHIFQLTLQEAMQIDCFSLHSHIMFGMCSSDANNSQSIAAQYQEVAVMAQAVTHKPSKQDLDTLYGFQMTLLKLLAKGGCFGYLTEIPSRCLYSTTGELSAAQTLQHLSTDSRCLVFPHWILENGIELHDFHDSKQLFAYQPGVQLRCTQRDNKLASSEQVICDHLQASIGKCTPDLSNWCEQALQSFSETQKDDSSIDITGNKDISYFSDTNKYENSSHLTTPDDALLLALENEAHPGVKYVTNETNQSIEYYLKTYQDESEKLCNQLDALYYIHKITSTFSTAILPCKTVLGDTSCLLCTLSIQPHFRSILLDLVALVNEKSQQLYLGSSGKCEQMMILSSHADTSQFSYGTAAELEKEVQYDFKTKYIEKRKGRKNPTTQKKSIDNAMKPTDRKTTIYSYNLDKSNINIASIDSVFDEWYKKKYPFLAKWFEKYDIKRKWIVEQLFHHLSCNQSLSCIINIRRLLTDSNEHITHGHTCSLPFISGIYHTMKFNDRLYHNHKETLFKLCGRHHISPVL